MPISGYNTISSIPKEKKNKIPFISRGVRKEWANEV